MLNGHFHEHPYVRYVGTSMGQIGPYDPSTVSTFETGDIGVGPTYRHIEARVSHKPVPCNRMTVPPSPGTHGSGIVMFKDEKCVLIIIDESTDVLPMEGFHSEI